MYICLFSEYTYMVVFIQLPFGLHVDQTTCKSTDCTYNYIIHKLYNIIIIDSFAADYTLSHKRNRSPPSYTIHRPQGGLALAPPCPVYGAVQLPGFEGTYMY